MTFCFIHAKIKNTHYLYNEQKDEGEMKAIIVIDMQEDYVKQYELDLLNRVNKRIMQAKKNNEHIIYIKNTKILRSGTYTPEFATGLQILSSNIFCKEAASMFTNNNLETYLKDNKITEIELLGVDGNSCVAISAVEGYKNGYTTILPCSYIGVKNKEIFLQKKEQLRKSGIVIWE